MLRVPRNLYSTLIHSRSLLLWSKIVLTQAKFAIGMIRDTLRDDNETRIGYKIKFNPDDWKVRCGYPWMLVNWICLCFSLFLCSRALTLIVGDSSSFKIEEWRQKMAISSKNGRVEQKNHFFLTEWNGLSFRWDHLLWPLDILFDICASLSPFQKLHCFFILYLCLSLFLIHPLILLNYVYCFSIYCSRRRNTRRRSLSMRVPRKEWTVPQLTGVYGMLRVPRDLDPPLNHCPVLVECLSVSDSTMILVIELLESFILAY